MKLSTKEHWEGVHKQTTSRKPRFRSYCDQRLIKLCRKYLPNNSNYKFLEVGCTPGINMIMFHEVFGFELFGVDYSLLGCDITRQTLYANGLDTNNVFMYDFVSNRFQTRFKEQFDVVFSAGLLEHFKNSADIIDKHLNLLKPRGYIIITIPNLLGINGKISDFLNPEITKICNLEIMNPSRFSELFERKDLKLLYCGYYGIFNFGLFNAPRGSKKQIFMHIGGISQILIDRILIRAFLNRNIECSAINPYLVYIGKKTTDVLGTP